MIRIIFTKTLLIIAFIGFIGGIYAGEQNVTDSVKLYKYSMLQPDSLLSVKMYPNPATNLLNVELKFYNQTQMSVKLYNILGKVFYDNSFYDKNVLLSIPTSGLVNGAYFLSIANGNSLHSYKILVRN